MKKIKANELKIKLLSITTALTMMSTGVNAYASSKSINNVKYDNKHEEIFINTENDYLNNSNKDIKSINLSLDFETSDEMISFYSKVFELNEEVVTNKIYEIINNDVYSWYYANTLNNVSYDTVEQAIARIICDIDKNPEDYNLTDDDIKIDTEYELDYFIPEELIYKFSNVLGVNPNLALSIAYSECGRRLDSYNFTVNHNPGGIRGSNGYVVYKNEAVGLFKFIILLHDNYGVRTDSGNEKINSMASRYCELPDHWISLVSGNFYDLNTHGYDYSYNNYNYQGRNLVLSGNQKTDDEPKLVRH